MGKWMNGYLEKLALIRQESLIGGGQDRIDLQHSLGKLTARERIDRFLDSGTFDEIGTLVRDSRPCLDGKIRPSPGEGIIMGYGKTNGHPVMVFSIDFTVMSGSLGDQAAWKLADIVDMAGKRRIPVIGMMDAAGERLSIREGNSGLNGLARLIKNY